MKMTKGVRWYGRNHGRKEDVAKCIHEVWHGWTQNQCNRNRGHGPDGLYCKQHDPDRIKAKRGAEDRERKKKQRKQDRRDNRRELEQEYCKPFTSTEMKRRIRMRKKGEQV